MFSCARWHELRNEPVRSAFTGRVLDRVGRALGARDGTGPDDTLWLRAHREEGRARGRSDGQQKKIELARSIAEPADLLIWDEPLTGRVLDGRSSTSTGVSWSNRPCCAIRRRSYSSSTMRRSSTKCRPDASSWSPRGARTREPHVERARNRSDRSRADRMRRPGHGTALSVVRELNTP